MPEINLTVPSDFSEQIRLDKYISLALKDMNRSKLKSGLKELRVNNKNAKISRKIKAGDEISILWEDNIPDDIEPENIPLEILYEDENVTVVNKKQGMVTHPASGNWNGTLVNALLFHWGRQALKDIKADSETETLQKMRPGIVHRLDKDTSGIIITARNRETEEFLQNQFKSRNLQKEYICICTGRPPSISGDIRTQIIRDPKNRQCFKAVENTSEGKFARTIYHCIAVYGNYSLIRVRIKTGRTHQIRVHMKYLGCPILGDELYNKTDSLFPNATLMLHSQKLKIKLPQKKDFTTFITPTPKRFLEIEKKLKEKYSKTVLNKKNVRN